MTDKTASTVTLCAKRICAEVLRHIFALEEITRSNAPGTILVAEVVRALELGRDHAVLDPDGDIQVGGGESVLDIIRETAVFHENLVCDPQLIELRTVYDEINIYHDNLDAIIQAAEASLGRYFGDIRTGIRDAAYASVVSFRPRILQDRIKERRLRMRWLRTTEGKAYLRDRYRKLQHLNRHKDPQRSRTAKRAYELYKGGR